MSDGSVAKKPISLKYQLFVQFHLLHTICTVTVIYIFSHGFVKTVMAAEKGVTVMLNIVYNDSDIVDILISGNRRQLAACDSGAM